jgi:hypothetical protein
MIDGNQAASSPATDGSSANASQATNSGATESPSLAAKADAGTRLREMAAKRDGQGASPRQGKENKKSLPKDSDQPEELNANESEGSEKESEAERPASEERSPSTDQHKGMQKRIDAITRQKHELTKELRTVRDEAERYKAAAELYRKEAERFYDKAKSNLDPREEALRQRELEMEISQRDESISKSMEEQWAEREAKARDEADAQEVYDLLESASQESDGLFSALELGRFMRQNKLYDTDAAAKKLTQQIEMAFQKRQAKLPKAPATAGSLSSGSRADPIKPSYNSTEDLANYFKRKLK